MHGAIIGIAWGQGFMAALVRGHTSQNLHNLSQPRNLHHCTLQAQSYTSMLKLSFTQNPEWSMFSEQDIAYLAEPCMCFLLIQSNLSVKGVNNT